MIKTREEQDELYKTHMETFATKKKVVEKVIDNLLCEDLQDDISPREED